MKPTHSHRLLRRAIVGTVLAMLLLAVALGAGGEINPEWPVDVSSAGGSIKATFPDGDVMAGDIDRDGAANAFDIDPFVALLLGG